MDKRKKNAILLSAMVFLLPGLSACARYDYRADAVEEARKFAIKNYPDLSIRQQDFIRYNEPVILIDTLRQSTTPDVPPNETMAERPTRFDQDDIDKAEYDTIHFCMVWDVPDLPGSFVVFGTGERSFRFRDMRRVFLKRYVSHSNPGSSEAIEFFIRTIPGISEEDRIHVRFVPPEMYATNFHLEPEEVEKPDSTGKNWMNYLKKEMNEEDKLSQSSYVWISPKNSMRLVVVGVTGGKYEQWTPRKAMILSQEDFMGGIDADAAKHGKLNQPKQIRFHERTPGRNHLLPKKKRSKEELEYWNTREIPAQ